MTRKTTLYDSDSCANLYISDAGGQGYEVAPQAVWLFSFLKANQLLQPESIMARVAYYLLALLFICLICLWERKVLFADRFTWKQTVHNGLYLLGLTILPIIVKGVVELLRN